MSNLASIPGIGKTSLELLEAAGFHDAEALARAGGDELTRELTRANSILKISKRTPARAAVQKWIDAARDQVGVKEDGGGNEAPATMPVDYEQTPEVVSMLAVAPLAIPLPARILVENQLAVSDIPPAILLNRYSGDLEIRTESLAPQAAQARPPQVRHQQAPATSHYVQIADAVPPRTEFDTSKLRSIDDMASPMLKAPSVKVSPGNDRVALLRAPRTSTNKGRNPNSRWYIRGVLHSHPVSVYLGAAVTLLLMVMVPAAVVSAALLLLSAEQPEKFAWVPSWLLVFPVVLPLIGIAYLLWGITSSCRICGQKLFTHRAHLKNSKAHHIRGLGYILPLCFQILIFRWFRCTHCGTPVRLKE